MYGAVYETDDVPRDYAGTGPDDTAAIPGSASKV